MGKVTSKDFNKPLANREGSGVPIRTQQQFWCLGSNSNGCALRSVEDPLLSYLGSPPISNPTP